MAKKIKTNQQMQEWIDARRRRHLSHSQVQMARELGLNPAKLGKIDNHKQEPCKLPLPSSSSDSISSVSAKLLPTTSCLSRSDVESKGAKRSETCRQAAACEGQHLKHGERRPRYCSAAVRGADSATTRGGDVRRSCRIEVGSVEQELPPRTSGA